MSADATCPILTAGFSLYQLSGCQESVKMFLGRVEDFSKGNTWEAFTCIQVTEGKQERRVL